MNLLSVMDGEIGRAGVVALGSRVHSLNVFQLPVAPKCQICSFCQAHMLLFPLHTVEDNSNMVDCHSPPSILFNHLFFLSHLPFKNIQFFYIFHQQLWTTSLFFFISMAMGNQVFVQCVKSNNLRIRYLKD